MKDRSVNCPEAVVLILDQNEDTIITGIIATNGSGASATALIRKNADAFPSGQVISGGGNTLTVDGVDLTVSTLSTIYLPCKIVVRKGQSISIDGGGNSVTLLT